MSRDSGSSQRKAVGRQERGEVTRQKLLTAAIQVFGRLGFDSTSTRALADAADVNLQAIHYYFGDKEGLYKATAEHIVELIGKHNAETAARVQARLAEAEQAGHPIDVSEARGLLTDVVQTLAMLSVDRASEQWVRFMVREQIEPTEVFKRIYDAVIRPGLETTGRLVGIVLGEPPESEHVRLRTLSLLGSVLVFRTTHATALAHLGWKGLGAREAKLVRALAAELVASMAAPN